MQETFSPGDIVRTIHLNNLYQVIEIDRKGRIVCDTINSTSLERFIHFPSRFAQERNPYPVPAMHSMERFTAGCHYRGTHDGNGQ